MIDARLYMLKNTLNQIEVHREENLDKLLGCLQAIKNMIREGEEKEREEKQHAENQTG